MRCEIQLFMKLLTDDISLIIGMKCHLNYLYFFHKRHETTYSEERLKMWYTEEYE